MYRKDQPLRYLRRASLVSVEDGRGADHVSPGGLFADQLESTDQAFVEPLIVLAYRALLEH